MVPNPRPTGVMCQETGFFTHSWTRKLDMLFIRGLCDQTAVGRHIIRGNANRRAIEYARDHVNGQEDTHFDYYWCLDRFRHLYKRYTVFHYIIEQVGVQHDEITHDVFADASTWNRICREQHLAYAYM